VKNYRWELREVSTADSEYPKNNECDADVCGIFKKQLHQQIKLYCNSYYILIGLDGKND